MADSLKELLSQRSPDNDIGLFAYGSLMWHPEISFDLSIRARIYGYQRNFFYGVLSIVVQMNCQDWFLDWSRAHSVLAGRSEYL